MTQYQKYEEMIKEIGQAICLDEKLHTGEAVALFDLMKQHGETAIKLLANKKYRSIKKILRQAK